MKYRIEVRDILGDYHYKVNETKKVLNIDDIEINIRHLDFIHCDDNKIINMSHVVSFKVEKLNG